MCRSLEEDGRFVKVLVEEDTELGSVFYKGGGLSDNNDPLEGGKGGPPWFITKERQHERLRGVMKCPVYS